GASSPPTRSTPRSQSSSTAKPVSRLVLSTDLTMRSSKKQACCCAHSNRCFATPSPRRKPPSQTFNYLAKLYGLTVVRHGVTPWCPKRASPEGPKGSGAEVVESLRMALVATGGFRL